MKAIKDAQSLDINDNCTTCGSMLDIGAVINESDTLLKIEFELTEEGKQSAQELVVQAQKSFNNVTAEISETESNIILTLDFDVAVEKMLFQMQNKGL